MLKGLLPLVLLLDTTWDRGELMPSRVGTKWIYDSKEGEVTFTLRQGLALERSHYLGWGRSTDILKVDRDGIRSVARTYSDNRAEFTPGWPMTRVRGPTEWKEEIASKFERDFQPYKDMVRFTRSTETIDVPAGRFRCFCLKAVFASKTDGREYQKVYWLAPGVGIVKFEFLDRGESRWRYELRRIVRP